MKINTLRFRISVFYVAIIGIILIFFQVVLYLNYVSSVSSEFDTQLRIKAEQIGGAVNTFRSMLSHQKQAFKTAVQKALNLSIEYPNYAFMLNSPEKFWLADAKKLGLDNDYLLIMDMQGNIIGKSKNVTKAFIQYFKLTGRSKFNKNMFYRAKVDKNILRIVAMPYFYTYKQGYVIVVGSSYSPIEKVLRRHLFFLTASTIIFLFIASLIVRIFVISVLSSVLEISNVARNISQENLHARIRLTHTDEEIEHLTTSLNDMIARLEKSFAHIKEFSLEMAHEVKTPLAIISGESQMALEKEYSAKEYKEIFSVIYKEAKRSQQFVSDLLLLTKLDYRLIKLRFESIDINRFLSEICDEMRVISMSHGVIIQQELCHETLFINGDKTHLRRVFFNLIDNALKFTLPKGHIQVALKCSHQNAVILVSDNGRGIAAEDVTKIFNKFYRVAADSDPGMVTGCGLGLSIANSIVGFHQGQITVNSELGKGTTFRVEFPFVNSQVLSRN